MQADLAWLREHGWENHLKRHLRYGGKVIGLCGGMQMLGTALHDPLGLEGAAGSAPGLGLLALETTLGAEKQLRQVSGHLLLADSAACTGYEIHLGVCAGPALDHPALRFSDGRLDGALSADGQILATYCHGLFDHPAALSALLNWAHGAQSGVSDRFMQVDPGARREADIDRLADAVEAALDWSKLALSGRRN